jgi:hypothetical protein
MQASRCWESLTGFSIHHMQVVKLTHLPLIMEAYSTGTPPAEMARRDSPCFQISD